MKRPIRLLAALLLILPLQAHAAEGCGTTYGTATTDKIDTNYTTTITGPRSYSFWVYYNASGGGGNGKVFNKGGTATTVEYLVVNPTISYNVPFSTTIGTWNASSVSTGVWKNIVITYDSGSVANVPVIYLAGVSQSISTISTPVGTASTDANHYFLCNTSANNRNFDGIIADFAIWNVILTQDEATALARGTPAFLVRNNAIQYYARMIGGQVKDWGPSHLSATVTGALNQNHAPAFSSVR